MTKIRRGMNDIRKAALPAVFLALILPALISAAGENTGDRVREEPVSAERRDAAFQETVGRMQNAVGEALEAAKLNHMDVIHAVKIVNRETDGSDKRELEEYFRGRLVEIGRAALKTRFNLAEECRRIADFLFAYVEHEKTAAGRRLEEEFGRLEAPQFPEPPRERPDRRMEFKERLRVEHERLDGAGRLIWDVASASKTVEAARRLGSLYEQLREAVQYLKRLGEDVSMPDENEWMKINVNSEGEKDPRRKRAADPREWEEPGEKSQPRGENPPVGPAPMPPGPPFPPNPQRK